MVVKKDLSTEAKLKTKPKPKKKRPQSKNNKKTKTKLSPKKLSPKKLSPKKLSPKLSPKSKEMQCFNFKNENECTVSSRCLWKNNKCQSNLFDRIGIDIINPKVDDYNKINNYRIFLLGEKNLTPVQYDDLQVLEQFTPILYNIAKEIDKISTDKLRHADSVEQRNNVLIGIGKFIVERLLYRYYGYFSPYISHYIQETTFTPTILISIATFFLFEFRKIKYTNNISYIKEILTKISWNIL